MNFGRFKEFPTVFIADPRKYDLIGAVIHSFQLRSALQKQYFNLCFRHFTHIAMMLFLLKTMGMGIKETSYIQPEFYIKNQKYFDERLIKLLENQSARIEKLQEEVAVYKTALNKERQHMKGFQIKIKDLKAVAYNLEHKHIKDEESIDEITKKIDSVIKDMTDEIADIRKDNEDMRQKIKDLEKEVNEYKRKERKMKKSNSTNTNFPTSHYPFQKKKANENSRVKTGKHVGGQSGHVYHSIGLKKADSVEAHIVQQVPRAAVPHTDEAGNIDYYITQEIDASLKPVITEHRYWASPNAEPLSKAYMDTYRINPVAYAQDFKAAVLYLNVKGAIAYDRECEIINTISHGAIDLKPGTIVNWSKEFERLSQPDREQILNDIRNYLYVHVDETSADVNGKNCWLHAMGNPCGAYFVLTEKRSDDKTGPLKLLKDYMGILIHDHLLSYYRIPCKHAECNGHTDRYLQAGIDIEESAACVEMMDLLIKAKKRKEELIASGVSQMDPEELAGIRQKYKDILTTELERYEKAHPYIAKKYTADYIKLFRRMLKYQDEHLRFLENFAIPYTNNFCEKLCRTVKKKKNISWQFKSIETGNCYCALLTIQETARIKQQNELEAYKRIMAKRFIDDEGRDLKPRPLLNPFHFVAE